MKFFLSLFIISATLFSYAQSKDFTAGKVSTVSGKLVFDNVDPVMEYEIVFSFENLLEKNELESQETIWYASVENAMMESGYQGGKPFDAIVTKDEAKRDIAIKFKSNSPDNAIAIMGERIEGVYVFTVGLPYYQYDHIAALKVNEEKHTSEEAFAKIINKAKKKYGNFNGIIFSTTDLSKAELIKFTDLEITGGGFRVGDFVMHQSGMRPSYGVVSSLDNTKQKAGFIYLDEYGEEKVVNIKYKDLVKVDEEKYNSKLIEQSEEVKLHQFVIDEKVTWDNGGAFGKVIAIDERKHHVQIEFINVYGEKEDKSIDFLMVDKLEQAEYDMKLAKILTETAKHHFEIGEKVSFEKGGVLIYGEVIELNDTLHRASVKYTDDKGEESKSSVNYLKLEKVK